MAERKKLYIYPNKSARLVARRALDRRKKLPRSKRGGLDAQQAHEQGIGSGVMRARDIASGKRVNAYQVKAFFDRHRGNYMKARADGKRWEDSRALQAWDLWGGEHLRKQVERSAKIDRKVNPPNARELVKQCREVWMHYCDRPNKTRLISVIRHLDAMGKSDAKSVRNERSRCMAVVSKEKKKYKM